MHAQLSLSGFMTVKQALASVMISKLPLFKAGAVYSITAVLFTHASKGVFASQPEG
jgi:hypothetical protein